MGSSQFAMTFASSSAILIMMTVEDKRMEWDGVELLHADLAVG